nr:hypothetical protein [Tanacetum cinerariifolium]
MEQNREIGNGVIDISIGLMGIRLMDCVVSENGKMEQKIEMGNDIDDEVVIESNDASGVIDITMGLMGYENEEEEDCSIEEIESNRVTDITGGWIGVGELCKEDGKGKQIESSGVITNSFRLKVYKEDVEVKGSQSKNSKEDDKNKKCLQNYNDIVKGSKLMDNGHVRCGNRGMSKVAWKPLVQIWMNRGINESVVSESISEVKLAFKGSTWSLLEEHDINNFKGIWEDLEKMIILFTHVVSGVKWGLSDSKGKDANKNGVNSCYWELSECKWRGRKKTCGIFCQVKNNKWKFDIWRWPKRKKKTLWLGNIGVLMDGN